MNGTETQLLLSLADDNQVRRTLTKHKSEPYQVTYFIEHATD